ncbi:MAG: nucleotide exchange factor GrpE [Cyanobacteriota bacterium]
MREEEAAQVVSDGLSDRELAELESLRQENEALKAKLEEINQQSDALKNHSMRMAADFDNFRKRTAKEKEDLEQQIKRITITELLPVVDNFERARSQIKPQNDGEMGIHKSYQGVYKQLVDSLKRLGVSAMRPEGQEFDPNFHEAVMREPSNEYPEGAVIEQLVRGYFLGDRVLRHAMVKVASAPETPSESSDETSTDSPS